MDLKVSIEGVLREVCGVSETTTCEEIIFKLAQAASLPGFYTLVVRYHGKEETLSPEERIVTFLRTIKEKPSNVQFVLRRLEAPSPRPGPSQTHQPTILHRSGDRHASVTSHAVRADSPKQPTNLGEPLHAPTTNWNVSRAQSVVSSPPKHILHRTLGVEPSTGSGDIPDARPTRFDSELDEYRQLEDQLAYQEREVELNRIHLLRLDKGNLFVRYGIFLFYLFLLCVEIAELEQNSRLVSGPDSGFVVGPAAELAQLAAAPWPQLLEANRARQQDLLKERERHQFAVERVTGQLEKAREEAAQLEARVSQELARLLVTLEAANVTRRQQLRSLSPPTVYPRPSNSTSADGVAI
ncbi:Ras association domain-containing protein 8 [Fasciolopsis buskii]|uniref:Ras association domain-containing protein 8 n=1 Tax=Fasciolopsis buskii TaxID=27845 RepID=A0A8E0VN43_9TREM|nr:Ras association domain-containing protein 8 [Fasciolopsis buski]